METVSKKKRGRPQTAQRPRATQGDPRIVADGDILITTRTVIKRVRMRFASEINGECALL